MNKVLVIIAISIIVIGCGFLASVKYLEWDTKCKEPIISTPKVSLNPPSLVSEGYLIKMTDLYGREVWRIGTQMVNPTDEFCILSNQDSPTFFDDMFSRYQISILRTDQIYKLYLCEFRKSDSSRQGSWIETIWSIQAITDNLTTKNKD